MYIFIRIVKSGFIYPLPYIFVPYIIVNSIYQVREPKGYKFGYNIKDQHSSQFRKEEGDGHGAVKGSYGYTDEHGNQQEVHYEADHDGYRAVVKSNAEENGNNTGHFYSTYNIK